jgi:hypothetical protein
MKGSHGEGTSAPFRLSALRTQLMSVDEDDYSINEDGVIAIATHSNIDAISEGNRLSVDAVPKLLLLSQSMNGMV